MNEKPVLLAPQRSEAKQSVEILERWLQWTRDGVIGEVLIIGREFPAGAWRNEASGGSHLEAIGELECLKSRLIKGLSR